MLEAHCGSTRVCSSLGEFFSGYIEGMRRKSGAVYWNLAETYRARLHPDSRCASPQSQRHFAFYSPQPVDGGDGCVGVRQIVAGVRHGVCGGTAAVRGIDVGVCAAVPGADGEAGCGRDRRHRSGGRDPAEEHEPESALDGGDVDRVLRLLAAAVRAGGADVLSDVRHAGSQGHGGRGGGAAARTAGGIALVCDLPVRRARLHAGAAGPSVRAAEEGLQPAVSGRAAVRVLDSGIAAGYRLLEAAVHTGGPAGDRVRTCISGWWIRSRSAIARRAR